MTTAEIGVGESLQQADVRLGPGAIIPNERGIGPGLTEHQKEMLVRLIQEAGEVVQSATKLLLFGAVATNPTKPVTYDNVEDLSMEVGDLHQMIEEVNSLGLINPEAVERGIERKKANLAKYLVTNRPPPFTLCVDCPLPIHCGDAAECRRGDVDNEQ